MTPKEKPIIIKIPRNFIPNEIAKKYRILTKANNVIKKLKNKL